MSPRAAWRLERLGYEVYDYVLSKVDWLAAGLPTVRAVPARPRMSDALDAPSAVCAPEDLVSEVRQRVSGDECLVVNEAGIVLGRLRLNRDHADDATAEDAMHPGPTTVRADADLAETLERMRRRNVRSIIVTTAEGVLLGVLHAP